MDINERIEANVENFVISNNNKKVQYEILKQEKDDSSSDIDILDYVDTSQSSVSSQWSIINPIVNIPEKILIKQKSIGIQTDDKAIKVLIWVLNSKYPIYACIFILLFLTVSLFSETNEKPLKLISSLEDLNSMIKELKRDVKQIQELHNSNINFNEMLNYNFTSIMTEVADLKFNMRLLKEQTNMLKYNFLEENLKDLQNHNRNLTDEVKKLTMLVKNNSKNCNYIKEDILKLNSFVYNIIQITNEKIQKKCHSFNLSNNFDNINLQNKSTNYTSKYETNTTETNSESSSISGDWMFRRAQARRTQRRQKNSRAWQLVRAYGRELLRWIDKASSISNWY